ncbi:MULTISPECIES: nucleoside deaminase [Microbacterium]|uniref:tRNA-specific adenosine deaminase n=1 Tax=Microbacterium oleivorans TaxID=273677 RepID=A0A4R5YLI2_9MICO|nr:MULTISPECIES: nucleoside deaminase [Microbacterium]TDL46365.1 nucleoside deaminase [Microbacterium oleivorans]
MVRALELAASAPAHGDVPVGAAVMRAGRIIGEGRNLRERDGDPLAHAEIVALRAAASALGSWNLEECTLVVTLEPCVMCAGAILQTRVGRVVFGAWDEKAGAAGSVHDLLRDRRMPHRAEVLGGVRAGESADLLRAFFDAKR